MARSLVVAEIVQIVPTIRVVIMRLIAVICSTTATPPLAQTAAAASTRRSSRSRSGSARARA